MKKTSLSLLMLAVLATGSNLAFAANGPRILAVGDSITFGATFNADDSVETDTPGGYRTNFYQTMVANNANMLFVGSSTANPSTVLTNAGQTAHEGHGGWTVATDVYNPLNSMVYNIDTWMQNSNPDIVTIMGGVNDILLLRDSVGSATAVTRTTNAMDLMLNKIFTDKPKVQVFLSNLIPTAGTRLGYNSTVIAYNANLQNTLVPKYQALGYNIHFVDEYSNFITNGSPDGTHLSDGLHPDATGYNTMGATFGNAVAPIAKSLNLRAAPIIVDIAGNDAWNKTNTLNGQAIRMNSTWTGGISALVGTDGTSSSYGFKWVSYNPVYMNSTSSSFITGTAASLFPNDTARSFWGAPSGNTLVFQLTGLSAGTKYVLDLFGGHEDGNDVTRFVAVGSNTLTGDLTTGNNGSNVLALSGILPDANGNITVTVSAEAGSNALYFNTFSFNEVTVPEPASLGLLALGSLAMLRRRK